jgi:hypothetical protein
MGADQKRQSDDFYFHIFVGHNRFPVRGARALRIRKVTVSDSVSLVSGSIGRPLDHVLKISLEKNVQEKQSEKHFGRR